MGNQTRTARALRPLTTNAPESFRSPTHGKGRSRPVSSRLPYPPSTPTPVPALHANDLGRSRMLISIVCCGRRVTSADNLSLTPELLAAGTCDVPLTSFLQLSCAKATWWSNRCRGSWRASWGPTAG